MLKLRDKVLVAVCVVTTAALGIAQGWSAEADKANAAAQRERQWIGVLQSSAPPQEKAITCKRLAVDGSKEAVPALAALLPDKDLASWARIALEAIPDPAVDEALRQAAGKLQGRLLVGVINSIGVRRDAQAIEVLAKNLQDADADVASAAAVALGRIGNAAAGKVLEPRLAGAVVAVRPYVAEGCLLVAEKALADGNRDEAIRLYDMIRKAELPKYRILEATRGAILARQAAGVPLLVEQLKSEDKALVAIGLRVARELPGSEVTKALVAELDKATPERRALLILALADRGDAAPLPALMEAAKSGPNNVRIVAMRVLQRQGNATCVPLLLEAAVENDAEMAGTAAEVLAGLPGKEVDADLAARLLQATGKGRLLLIELAGQRRIEAAVPALLKAADDPDAAVRGAALAALGQTVSPNDLAILIDRVVKPTKAQEKESKIAEDALYAACIRMADREACAEKLVVAMGQASIPAKCVILKVLGAMGGAKALAAVTAAANDSNPELQDAGSRFLGEWMTADAAPKLLDLAKNSQTSRLKQRALRGYLRIARQLNLPPAERLAMYREALTLAQRDDERRLAVEILIRVRSADSLALALGHLDNPALAETASAVAVAISDKIVAADPAAVTKAMNRVLKVTKKPDVANKARTVLAKAAKEGEKK